MKSTEISVGTDYAFVSYLPKRGAYGLIGTDRPERVRVTAAPQHGEVTVDIYDTPKARKPSGSRIVSVRNLIATWAEHTERQAAREQARQETLDRRAANIATIRRLLGGKRAADRLLPSYGFNDRVERDGSFSTGGQVTIDEMAAIVRTAYEMGRADAASTK